MKRHLDTFFSLLVIALIAATILFMLVPLVVSIMMSFDARSYLGPFPPSEFSFHWYEKFISDQYYLNGLRTSIILGVIATLVATVIGVTAAISLHQYEFAGREVLSAFFLSPLVVPAVVLGFALLLFFSTIGIYDGFFRLLGGHVILTIPFIIRTTLGGLVGIQPSLVESALILGANERQAFWEITFPLAKTGIIAGAVFAFAISLDDVAVSIFLANPKAYTLPIALVSMMKGNFDLTVAAASVLLMAFTIFLIVMLDRIVGLDRVVGQGIYRG